MAIPYATILILAIAAFTICASNGSTVETLSQVSGHHLISTPKPVSNCTAEDWRNINGSWTLTKQCYQGIIEKYLGHETYNVCSRADDLKPHIRSFMGSADCVPDKRRLNASIYAFYELVNFTTADNKFKEFVANNGSRCLLKMRHNITQCIRSVTGRTNATSSTLNLTHIFMLRFDDENGGCAEENRMKTCLEKELKTDTTACRSSSVKFVNSLFDFVLDKYCKDNKNTTPSGSVHLSTNFLFSAFAALAIFL